MRLLSIDGITNKLLSRIALCHSTENRNRVKLFIASFFSSRFINLLVVAHIWPRQQKTHEANGVSNVAENEVFTQNMRKHVILSEASVNWQSQCVFVVCFVRVCESERRMALFRNEQDLLVRS